MIYKRGKGASVFNNSGFRNYGCLMGVFLFPLQILWIALKTILYKLHAKYGT